MMKQNLISTSKFLSLVLRHQPEVINLKLDGEGWAEIDQLIEQANQSGNKISLELIHEVIATNDKQRFALSDDGLRIRANQGHSVAGVELNLQPQTPPDLLYHGTVNNFLESIRAEGLLKRSRHHVHLSADRETAVKVGSRRGKPIVLTIEAARMHKEGHCFYFSANGVWLADAVPSEFIRFDN